MELASVNLTVTMRDGWMDGWMMDEGTLFH